MRIKDGGMRSCEHCRIVHHASFFPSPVSRQCASSMLGRPLSDIDVHHPMALDIAAIEVVSGLPVSQWVKKNKHWHYVWSKLMYAHAVASGKASVRLKGWSEESLPKHAS